MAVTQFFTIELPEGVDLNEVDTGRVTLSRGQAQSLCDDLGEALHPGGAQWREAPAQTPQTGEGTGVPPLHDTAQVSVEEMQARMQALAAVQSQPNVRQSPGGSGIGTGH